MKTKKETIQNNHFILDNIDDDEIYNINLEHLPKNTRDEVSDILNDEIVDNF